MIFRMILGHFIGDYFFQNNWMALNKKVYWFPLIVHCLIYTATIALFVPEIPWYLWPLVFLSHIIFDRTHIINWWFKLIRGRSIDTMIADYQNLNVCNYTEIDDIMRHSTLSITWFVQIVADNTAHIGLLYLILWFFVIKTNGLIV